MSQSEFVRTMVQAGRRGFSPPEAADTGHETTPNRDPSPHVDAEPERQNEEPPSAGATPGVEAGETGSSEAAESDDGSDLEDRVLDVLDRETVLSWEELVEEITDDIERQLDEAIESLQTENRVRYSGREGGYTLADRP